MMAARITSWRPIAAALLAGGMLLAGTARAALFEYD
ncbi:MAG: hypothetical protein JWQ13_2352, partial [Ramlibacter sp.]|nr:hypothetical protein [Ramlibacter sp.]